MISIVPYQSNWPAEFQTIGKTIRESLGSLAVRIDHIGSTSVPNLAAKDLIDIQITVNDLDSRVEAGLNRIGHNRLKDVNQDHVPPGKTTDAREWRKWIFKPAPSQRPTNVHVRIAGRANQRYPLLFRDYLRAHPAAAQAYGQLKTALAKYHAEDIAAYYDVKDPVCDIIMEGAEEWASVIHWKAGKTDC